MIESRDIFVRDRKERLSLRITRRSTYQKNRGQCVDGRSPDLRNSLMYILEDCIASVFVKIITSISEKRNQRCGFKLAT